MQDKILIKAPAKINLFLKILKKRKDNYHDIFSGLTFIDLFDELTITKSEKMSINYEGLFKPKLGSYKDCIIKKTLKFFNIDNKINLMINIKKNIPVKAGLGSASTNAAALIRGLSQLQIIQLPLLDNNFVSIGSDIPACILSKDCLLEGVGDKITKYSFPKYFFLLVKPNINLSTREMFLKIDNNFTQNFILKKIKKNKIDIKDYTNDFEKIAIDESEDIANLLNLFSKSKSSLFSGMTGSGSCCYAAFRNYELAKKAELEIKSKFSNFWSYIVQNKIKDVWS